MTDINQAAVLAGGITPGDTPGFPARISVPGYYRLTSNLEVPGGTAHAIEIVTSHVTIDMNGYLISRKTPDLTAAIFGAAERVNFVKVYNGHFRGTGGIDLGGTGNCVRDVQLEGAEEGSATGLRLGDLGLITGNQVTKTDTAFIVGNNGVVTDNLTVHSGHGVRAGQNAIVTGNTIDGNAAQASIIAGDGSIVGTNIAGRNDAGIQAGNQCLLKDNTVHSNTDFGIGAGNGSVVVGNRVTKVKNGPGISSGAGSMVGGNAITACGEGVRTTEGTLIDGNAASGCTTFGLIMQPTSGYAVNVLNANNGGGVQVSGGFQVDKNECNGAFCP